MSIAVARPYASAAFRHAAADDKALPAWEKALAEMARVVETAASEKQLISDKQLAEAIASLLKLDEAQQRFLDVLVENGRVQALPFIAERFTALRMEKDGIVEVRVESAGEIKDKKTFNDFLSKWVGAKVQPHYEQNESLIGGVRVYVHDNVLDASVLGRLTRLSTTLKQGLN